jgi:hypothetical protein
MVFFELSIKIINYRMHAGIHAASRKLPEGVVTSSQDGEKREQKRLTFKTKQLILKRCQCSNRFEAELAGLCELQMSGH